MRNLAAAAICALMLALPAAAQEPQRQFGERVDVNAVLLDVVVTDDRGNQILGLSKDDFVVTEDGERQTIDSVDYFTTRRLLDSTEGNAPFKVEQVHEERYFIFFFDKPLGGQLWDEIARARGAVNSFIDRDLGKNDLVAIVGHDVRLKVYSDFTSDKKQLKRAIADSARFGNGTKTPNATGPSVFRIAGKDRMVGETGTVYEAIRAIADSVRPIRGRKNLVIFSAGIRDQSEEVRNGLLLNESRYFRPMIDALNAANVTVYAKNLLTNPPMDQVFHQTLDRLAADTNGEYFRNAVSYEPVIKAVEKASGGYYLLTYRSQKPATEKGFQKVKVTVVNPEFRVRARAGYSYGE